MADRNGVDQKVIAETLRDVARYIQGKNIGKAHAALADNWLNPKVPSAEEISYISSFVLGYESGEKTDEGMAGHFDSEERRWLSEYGYPNLIEHMTDEAFGYFLEQNLEAEVGRDFSSYWPHKLVPTLIGLRDVLHFCAHREALEGKEPVAQRLIGRIEDFKGFSGPCHLAGTDLEHESRTYISRTKRHSSETYEEPAEPDVDTLNAVHFAFNWLEHDWLPGADADIMEARFVIGGNGNKRASKNSELAGYKASIQEGLRKADIEADLTVELGETYGEDAVVIRMSQQEYAKYVDIKRGQRDIEDFPGAEIAGVSTSESFCGYIPGTSAFYGPGGVYIAAAVLNAAQSAPRQDIVAEDIAWVRETGFVDEKEVVLPVGENAHETFIKFSKDYKIPHDQQPFIVGQRYWNSCDLHNEINRKLERVIGFMRDDPLCGPSHYGRSLLASDWFECAGKVYAPKNAAFEQAAFHFNQVADVPYGTCYTVYSENLEKLSGTGDITLFTERNDKNKAFDALRRRMGDRFWYVFHTDALPEEKRDETRGYLEQALDDIKDDIDACGTGIGMPSVMPKRCLPGPQ